MTCRVRVASPNDEAVTGELMPLLQELAQAGRFDDFCWLARSRGVTPEKITRLWTAMTALTAGDA